MSYIQMHVDIIAYKYTYIHTILNSRLKTILTISPRFYTDDNFIFISRPTLSFHDLLSSPLKLFATDCGLSFRIIKRIYIHTHTYTHTYKHTHTCTTCKLNLSYDRHRH